MQNVMQGMTVTLAYVNILLVTERSGAIATVMGTHVLQKRSTCPVMEDCDSIAGDVLMASR